MKFKIIFSIVLTALISSCSKEDLDWNLTRENSFDVHNSTPCLTNNCNSLIDINTFVDKISPSSSASWYIGLGQVGNGFVITESCYGGYIEFSAIINSKAKMTFWTKSINPGYSNIVPEVVIDGSITNTVLIDSSTSYNDWMQLETPVFAPGSHVIRINFPHRSTYYQYYIDEIEFWCQ